MREKCSQPDSLKDGHKNKNEYFFNLVNKLLFNTDKYNILTKLIYKCYLYGLIIAITLITNTFFCKTTSFLLLFWQ